MHKVEFLTSFTSSPPKISIVYPVYLFLAKNMKLLTKTFKTCFQNYIYYCIVASGDYISATQLMLIAHSLSRPVLVNISLLRRSADVPTPFHRLATVWCFYNLRRIKNLSSEIAQMIGYAN